MHPDAGPTPNPAFRPGRVPPPGGAEVYHFHRGLPGYAATPVRSLPAVAAELGLGEVALKDESDRFGLPAFKILGTSWAVERVLRRRPDTHTLVAASAGNHGRAVARCAADRGLSCRIYLPAGASAERAAAIVAEGARVVQGGTYDGAAETAHRYADRAGHALVADFAPSGEPDSPAWVVDGYSTLFRELAEQLDDPPDLLVVPIGVGALAAAAVRWAVHESRPTRVVGVEPATAACLTCSLRVGRPVTVPTPGTTMSGLDCATPSPVAWPTLRDGLAGTLTVTDAEVTVAMSDLAGWGMRIGDCGAATLAGLRRLVSDPDCARLRTALDVDVRTRVVCLGTEGPTDPVAYRRLIGTAVTSSSGG
ncbi:pyridoxal-phosphate dependent enzyme [Plantactinospora sp. B6F1]|uniref:pyridoxal-phosphate dependent enzyme n=1 Tax=Plantactinospora sp. B6F1 TaxID=3158971 RepID=UPI0032D90746